MSPAKKPQIGASVGGLVAPVEVAAAAPEVVAVDLDFGARVLDRLLAGPREHGRLQRDGRLLTVHRLLESGLLFRLEQRMIVEGIHGPVVTEGHGVLELRVPLFELEMVLNDLREDRRCLYRHRGLSCSGGVTCRKRGILALSRLR